MSKHQHKEAFCLMWYACKCGHAERLWNSRDGVTPFGGIPCPSCGGDLRHEDWHLDTYAPDHKPHEGQRYFRDGTAEEAVAIIERRIARYADTGLPMPEEIAQRLLQAARTQTGEWQTGWPTLDRWSAR